MSENDRMENQIKQIVNNTEKSPVKILDEFFEIYEPIFFNHNEMIDGLKAFASPLKEIIAAHQAWGMIGSDGFVNYFEATDSRFDNEVKKGFRLLKIENSYDALSEARTIYNKNNYAIPEDEDDRLFVQFYSPIEEFETITGIYLIKEYRKT